MHSALLRRCLALAPAITLLLASVTRAGDWPQILGPNRNGIAKNESLDAKWPAAGPKTLWQRSVGAGYAGIAVAGDRAILFHRLKDQEVVECMDAARGDVLWKQAFPTRYSSTIAPDNGPRCVPVVHGEQVFVFGAQGDLHCLALADGSPRWSRPLLKDFDGREGYFGAGSTPIVAGDRLLVNVGGRPEASIVALRLTDGKTLWTSFGDEASYSSPVLATLNDRRQALFITRLHVVSVDPQDGKTLFEFPFGMRGPTVNAASPIVNGDQLFVTASYGIGARLVDVFEGEPKEAWESDEAMSSQYTTPILHEGYLYGIHGRQDVGVAELRCVQLKTGKVAWSEPGFGTANLILAGDRLLIMKTDGTLVLAEASADKFQPLATTKIFNDTVQPLPALAHGRLFVRDAQTLKCLQVGK